MLERGTLAMDDLLCDLAMKRLGRAEEIGDPVLWLCSPGASSQRAKHRPSMADLPRNDA
jgi:NAD(P)-dependent dehydrogenase (short-subunit alcohol dehydrogenase family)